MKKLFCMQLLSTLLFCHIAFAQTNISGIWEGVLAVAPGQEIEVRFTFELAADGSYSGVLNAPDQPSLTNIPIDSVALTGDDITFLVSAVSGEYSGMLAAETITGVWSQAGTSFDLNLTPYEEPVLTAETFALIEGSWVATLRPIPGGELELTVILRFEESEAGVYRGFFSVPEQGASDIPIDSIEVDGTKLTAAVSQARIEISGNVTGDTIDAEFKQAGQILAAAFSRGAYEQAGLPISPLDYARISGPWNGSLNGMTLVIRVEQENDRYIAFMDSPDQGAANIPIGEMAIAGDTLTFAITAMNGSYSGDIGVDGISGTWTQAGSSNPLTLQRGAYIANADVPATTRERLSGIWRGTVNNTELIFQFADSAEAGFSATIAIPSLGAGPMPLSDISLEDNALSFTVSGIQASFAGTLEGSQITGDWTRAGNTNSLSLDRE